MKRLVTVLCLIFIILILWNEVEYNGIRYYEKPPVVGSSNLDNDFIDALEHLDQRALALKDTFKNKLSLKLANEHYISPDTLLLLQVYRQDSNTLVQNLVTMPDNFVGLTVNELDKILDNWEIKDYIPGKLMVLSTHLSVDKISSYLGIEGGRVAIFSGSESSKTLKEITNIEIDKLPPEEQHKLEKGISIDSDEELLSVLDGYISRISDD